MFEVNNNKMNDDSIDEIGENHIGTSAKTPLRPDAFDISDDKKIERKNFISIKYKHKQKLLISHDLL